MFRKTTSILPGLILATLSLHCGSTSTPSGTASGSTGGAVSSGGAGASSSTLGAGGSTSSTSGGTSAGGSAVSDNTGGSALGDDGDASGGTTGGSGNPSSNAGGGGASVSGGSSGVGMAGSAGSAGAAPVGPAATCPAGALLCEDFESYAENAAPTGKWKVTNVGSPTTVIDRMHAHSGSQAAHFHGKVDNNSQYTFLTANQAPTFPVNSSKVFVRFMLYITQWPSATATHTRLAWLGTNEALSTPQRGFDGGGYDLCNYNGIAIERFASGYFRNTNENMRDSTRVGKWNCFEMEIDNAGGPPPGGVGTALPHIFENDKEYTLALAGDHSVAYNAIKFEALQFSLWSPQADTINADYWIDDVVLSTQRINCPTQ